MKLFRGAGIYLAGLLLVCSHAAHADGGRTDLSGPGKAEVIADTGYEHTLFDSADNKCQHCHNDLYDTWKTSMHAKSWIDPIFQSKYQDFLRLQASKIGLYNEKTGKTYLPGMIKKTGQVCVKCHAPAAFYSADYNIEYDVIGDMNDSTWVSPEDPDNSGQPLYNNAYEQAQAEAQSNLAPGYDPEYKATVVSVAKTGEIYQVSYQIGHPHNREGINCSYCHSIETVRMMNTDDGDLGVYRLANDLKMGPIGPVVRPALSDLIYSPDASTPDMNAFFGLIGPDIGKKDGKPNVQDTAKDDFITWDETKAHDGRYVMKSIATGCETEDTEGNCTSGYYTGGPFYGPFGVTGLSNSRDDDLSERDALVKPGFQAAVDEAHADKFESRHQFAAYGKALCLSCHQRSSLMLNPDFNGVDGVQPGGENPDQFLELCSTWTAMSDGVGDNYTDTNTAPKCQRCHMEPLKKINGEAVTVLHQWDQPEVLFTKDSNPDLTEHFDPESGVGPVAEGYLNNHSFMGANTADFGTVKIKSGFKAGLKAEEDDDRIIVRTRLQNMTAHMFPGAHPMRRVLTRVVVTDANGNKVPYESATGKSKFKSIENKLASLDGNKIMAGFRKVEVEYNADRSIVIQGQTPNLDANGEPVMGQKMDPTPVSWSSPDATVSKGKGVPECVVDADGNCVPNSWSINGKTTIKKIVEDGDRLHFTRIYGRETGRRMSDGTHVVRPGFDSNIAADNRLEPNENEKYRIIYDVSDAEGPYNVEYRVYYLKKGGSGKFPVNPDGFLNEQENKDKKMAIFEVYRDSVILDD